MTDPVLDIAAVLASLQDQIDQLTATVEAQQDAIEHLQRQLRTRP